MDSNEVLSRINQYRQQDVKWDKVLNSICSKPLSIGIEAFVSGLDTNLGDTRIFKGTSNVEYEVIKILCNLFNGKESAGNIVSGGTEANLLALQVARKLRSDIKEPEILFSETVHFSILKAIEMMGLNYKILKTDEHYRVVPSEIKKLIGKNTVAIVATAGSSEFGSIDPVEDIAKIAVENNLYFHVDAATGGFIIPFAKQLGYELPEFDFSVNGVCSITVDPHKYGLVPIPAGGILFRDKGLQDRLKLDSYFVGTPSHSTLLGTRSGAPILATYAVLEHLGMEGFVEITKKNFENTKYLIGELKRKGYRLLFEPELNIVTFKVENAVDLLEQFEKAGMILSVSKRFDNVIRIVVNNHVSKEMLDEFIDILEKIKK